MPARATGAARSARVGGVRRLALALLAGGIALAASAQSYRLPDLKPPPPRVAPAPRAGEPCDGCGRIASIREVSTVRGPTGSAIAPVPGGADHSSPTQQNLIGAVIHLPLGGQRTDKPYIGGVGTPEMYARMRETSYEIAVRLDDGTIRVVRRADGTLFGVGDRVRWLGGDELELLAS
jgi:outer membrane lipoprotein SlyB